MSEKRKSAVACASCDIPINKRVCIIEDGVGSKGCPTLTREQILREAQKEYEDPEVREFARQASIQEAEGYTVWDQHPDIKLPIKPRIVEICEFAKKMGYKRLGLAFCGGLRKEVKIVEEILEAHEFEVVSVICKAGRTPKKAIGIRDEETVFKGADESMCNPIYQAKLFNHEKTQFNILVGLCVGHDSLFFKYAEAPTTVLAAKDRVTGHNPLVAVYLHDSYYRKVKYPDIP